jgi:DNA-binding transcriptional MerR regulator
MELYSIGTLSLRSGVPVKAMGFYSDRGLLPPARVAPTAITGIQIIARNFAHHIA